MRIVMATALVVLGLVGFAVRLVLEKDYDCWAPKLAALLVRMGSWWLPQAKRSRYRDEWLADLDVERQEGHSGIFHGLGVLMVAGPQVGFVERRRGRKTRRQWRRAVMEAAEVKRLRIENLVATAVGVVVAALVAANQVFVSVVAAAFAISMSLPSTLWSGLRLRRRR